MSAAEQANTALSQGNNIDSSEAGQSINKIIFSFQSLQQIIIKNK